MEFADTASCGFYASACETIESSPGSPTGVGEVNTLYSLVPALSAFPD